MGFLGFGANRFSKPGPGVKKNAPEKHRFVVFFEVFFRHFWQLITLNLLYVAFCIPIVTIGPATAGLMYVTRNFANEQPVFLWSDFWDTFKSNWKQSAFFFFLDLLIGAVSVFNFWFYFQSGVTENNWMWTIACGIFLVAVIYYIFMRFYVYTMMVTFDFKIKDLLRNSYIFAVTGFFKNLLTFVILVAIWGVSIYFLPAFIILFPVLLPAFSAYLINFMIKPTIQKYLLDPQTPKDDGPDEDEMVFQDPQ